MIRSRTFSAALVTAAKKHGARGIGKLELYLLVGHGNESAGKYPALGELNTHFLRRLDLRLILGRQRQRRGADQDGKRS